MPESNSTFSKNNKYQFLSGGGEMGKLTREKDWSNTAVGKPQTWPQSLRTTVSIILNSKFPMFLFWGPELICFYNDAYRPGLGKEGKHPFILGSRGEEYWKEIWHIIKPLIDQVLAGGETTWSEDQLIPIYRNGKLEDVYWTFSYSSVKDESGKPAGVFVTCSETTDKVKTYVRLEENKDQLHFAIEAADLGTFDYNPFTNKFSANDRLKNWFGLPAEANIELSDAVNAIAEKDRQKVSEAIQQTLQYSSGGNYNIEYTIIHPVTKKETIVCAKGKAWFNEDKVAYRFNGTLQDVTEQTLTRRKIEESEERYHNLIYSSPSAIGILYGEDLIITIANDAIIEIWGKGKEIIGKSYFVALPELAEQGYKEVFAEVYKTGKPFNAVETPVSILQNGVMELKYYNFLLYAQRNINGEIDGIGIIATEVTLQAILNKKIRESDQRFQAAVVAVQGILWTNNEKGEMEGEQAGWGALTGQSYDEYQGYGWSKAIHPDDAQPTVDAWNKAVKERITFVFEHRVKVKDGSWRQFSVRAIPLLSDDGTLREWVGVHTDITDTKIAGNALRENQEKLNIVIGASELGTYDLNLKTDVVDCSEKFHEIFGYTNGNKLNHKQFLNHLHPDDVLTRNEAFATALKTGNLLYQSKIIWNDKSIHWIEVKGKIFYGENHKPYKLIGTCRDITEEKDHQQELEENEQKFRLLADSMPQHIWTADTMGNLNYFNRSVFDYSGLTLQQINKDGWLQIVHPDDRDENIKQWTEAITTGKDFIFEHRFKRYDGEYRWQLSRAIPQKDAAENIQMWVGTSTDIQEIKELDQQKDYFISMASHELKTPITSIKGYVQILQSMYLNKKDAFLNNSLNVIEKQIGTLTNLISDLLDLSKIKSGSLFLNKETFKINDMVIEIIDEIKHINPDYTISLNIENEPLVYADRGRIGQVLINFLTNAVKYSPDSRNVKVESIVKDDQVIISVEDSGIGINKNDQAKIFERFYRVEGKNEKTFPGFGIGLFIASEIINRHKGKIGVKSEPGKGSVFYFLLPLNN